VIDSKYTWLAYAAVLTNILNWGYTRLIVSPLLVHFGWYTTVLPKAFPHLNHEDKEFSLESLRVSVAILLYIFSVLDLFWWWVMVKLTVQSIFKGRDNVDKDRIVGYLKKNKEE
jgi:hypothetical protein